MGNITYADAIAIFQLVYYTTCLPGSVYIAARHGATKTAGWIFLTIFCMVRIIGSSARIATIPDRTSSTPYTIALVCSVLGLSPLLMASLGLISRAYYSMLKQPWSIFFSFVIVKVVHTPAVVALILCIVGATSAASPTQINSETTVKVGVILFIVVYAMLTILTVGAWCTKRKTREGEGLLVFAVSCALPFMFVRLLYTVLSTFAHVTAFDLDTASQTATLFMSVLEEMIIVVIFIATGLKLPSVPDNQGSTPGSKLVYRSGRGDFGTGKLGLLSMGAGVVSAFSEKKRGEHTSPSQQPH